MPRSGPRRQIVATKLTDEEISSWDRRALDEGLTIRNGEPNRSEILRNALAYAAEHMPIGWRPESGEEAA